VALNSVQTTSNASKRAVSRSSARRIRSPKSPTTLRKRVEDVCSFPTNFVLGLQIAKDHARDSFDTEFILNPGSARCSIQSASRITYEIISPDTAQTQSDLRNSGYTSAKL